MVEHSVVVNEEVNDEDAVDYMQAIDSVKFDKSALDSNPLSNIQSGEIALQNADGNRRNNVLSNNFMEYTKEEERIIEKGILEMRDRIRKGQPLAHQMALNLTEQERVEDIDNCSQFVQDFTSALDGPSENVQSSGLAHKRLSEVPIGAKNVSKSIEFNSNELVINSIQSKNNNLYKNEIN